MRGVEVAVERPAVVHARGEERRVLARAVHVDRDRAAHRRGRAASRAAWSQRPVGRALQGALVSEARPRQHPSHDRHVRGGARSGWPSRSPRPRRASDTPGAEDGDRLERLQARPREDRAPSGSPSARRMLPSASRSTTADRVPRLDLNRLRSTTASSTASLTEKVTGHRVIRASRSASSMHADRVVDAAAHR